LWSDRVKSSTSSTGVKPGSSSTRAPGGAEIYQTVTNRKKKSGSGGNNRPQGRIVGSGCADTSVGIASGVQLQRKSVLHIDNLNKDCTSENLVAYLSSKNIATVSCFVSKSWLRSDGGNVSAFRVCLAAELKSAVFEPSLWPAGVIVRDWVFKNNSHGSSS